ncbi:MAG TPA: hypothetical protein VFZ72_18170 [Jiangellaceae bacterium]
MKRVIVPIVAVTLAAACAAVGRDDNVVDVGCTPYFRPAPGWEAVQLGVTATAANVRLGPNTLSGEGPWDTVERLAEADVLLYAMFWPTGETEHRLDEGPFAVDPLVESDLPPRELPLSLDDAQPGGMMGQPDHIYTERLGARVGGWSMDLFIFYGGTDQTGVRRAHTDPSAEAAAAAQEQLARLVVPAHG